MHCHSKPEHPHSGSVITHAECMHRDRNLIILTHSALFNNEKWADCQVVYLQMQTNFRL